MDVHVHHEGEDRYTVEIGRHALRLMNRTRGRRPDADRPVRRIARVLCGALRGEVLRAPRDRPRRVRGGRHLRDGGRPSRARWQHRPEAPAPPRVPELRERLTAVIDHCTVHNSISGNRRRYGWSSEPLRRPPRARAARPASPTASCSVGRVAEPVVQTEGARLPELDGVGHDPVAAPERRTRERHRRGTSRRAR